MQASSSLVGDSVDELVNSLFIHSFVILYCWFESNGRREVEPTYFLIILILFFCAFILWFDD
jgi:hypothetical protein